MTDIYCFLTTLKYITLFDTKLGIRFLCCSLVGVKLGGCAVLLSRTGRKIVWRMEDYLCMLLKLLRRGGAQYGFCVVLWNINVLWYCFGGYTVSHL